MDENTLHEKTLLREASTGDPKKIQALAKFRGQVDRDPSLYPWAGDQWKRMHWSLTVVDPCLLVEVHGTPIRHVVVSEGFQTKGRRSEGGGPPRDGTGALIPAATKHMPWQEWIWFTNSGGVPQKMRGWRVNKMPATCIYKVPPTVVAPAPPAPPPPPSPPPESHTPCPTREDPGHDVLSCVRCLEDALAALKASSPPAPPPPPNAPHVPSDA